MPGFGLQKAPRSRKLLLGFLVVVAVAYSAGTAFIWHAMRQPPEKFGQVMAKLPSPVVFLVFPFETLWKHARAGTLKEGDAAPDFVLSKVDKSGSVRLSDLTSRGPVVLVFGSYT